MIGMRQSGWRKGFGICLLSVMLGSIGASAQTSVCDENRDYLGEGRGFIREGDYVAAIDAFTCNLILRPGNYEALVDRMESAVIYGAYSRAVTDVNLLRTFIPILLDARLTRYAADIEADPAFINPRMFEILINWAKGDDEAVIPAADALIELDPNNAFAYLMRGSSLQYAGDRLTPLADFQQALNLGGENPEIYSIIGSTFVQTSDSMNGFLALDRAISLDPLNPRPYYFRGLAYYDDGYFQDAIPEFDEAVTLDGFYYDAYFDRAMTHMAMEDRTQALEDFTRVIEINPNFRLSYIRRGALYEQDGQLEAATGDFANFVRLYAEDYTEPTAIEPGETLTVTVEPEQAAPLELELDAGESVEISATTQGPLDALALLIGPDNAALAGSDDPTIGRRDPLIAFTAESAGTYLIVVTAAEPWRAANGDITVSVVNP